MICIGYDFGTTNSLVSQYTGAEDSPVRILKRSSSSIQDGSLYVRSPKRLLSENPIDERRACQYISDFSKGILSEATLSLPRKEPLFITASVPNAFKDYQCKLIIDCIRNVGGEIFTEEQFNHASVTIIPEPIAAALHYLTLPNLSLPASGLVAICDIGGGTTDLSLVDYAISFEDGKRKLCFKVMANQGDDALGGDDIDKSIATDIISLFGLENINYSEKMLYKACQALKRQLSVQDEAQVVLPGPDGVHPAINENGGEIVLSYTRKRLNLILKRDFLPSLKTVFTALIKEYVKNVQVDKDELRFRLQRCTILPVGGTSQIPYLQDIMKSCLLGSIFLLPGDTIDSQGRAPYDSVARGAAVYSAWMNHCISDMESIVIEGRTLHTISIKANDGVLVPIVEKNMPSDKLYSPASDLFPLYTDSDGKTFRLERIDLYEGEGKYVGDTRYGRPPQHLSSLAEQLENLNDKLYIHNRRDLRSIKIDVQLKIDEGRLHYMHVTIPEGNEDHSDYHKTFDFWA